MQSVYPSTHGHNDEAGLSDHVFDQLVEEGVGVIVEALELLHHVVQLQVRPERLGVEGAVHERRVKLEDGVVLALHVLDKLRETRKRERLLIE